LQTRPASSPSRSNPGSVTIRTQGRPHRVRVGHSAPGREGSLLPTVSGGETMSLPLTRPTRCTVPAHPPASSTGVTSPDPTCRGHDGATRPTIGPVRVHRTRTQPRACQTSPIGTDAGRSDSRLRYAVSRTGTLGIHRRRSTPRLGDRCAGPTRTRCAICSSSETPAELALSVMGLSNWPTGGSRQQPRASHLSCQESTDGRSHYSV
jgi:hypothetical protein